jgi:hypothetical protein
VCSVMLFWIFGQALEDPLVELYLVPIQVNQLRP